MGSLLQLLLGGVDMAVVLTFLAVAICYFLAPVVGYGSSNRQPFITSLWILMGLVALTILHFIILAAGEGDSKGVLITFVLLKGAAYLGALFMFIKGLQGLQKS